MKKVKHFINKYRLSILLFFVVGILVHLPLFTKNILTADVLLNTNYYNGYSWEISLGRFGLYFIGLLKGFYVFPEVEIFMAMVLLIGSCCLLFNLFSIKNKVIQVIMNILIVCSPIISSTLLFHYCSFPYMLAFFLGVLSIYLFYKSKRKIIKYFIPILCIMISLSMYQAYLSIPCTLVILYSIYLLLEDKFSIKEFLKAILVILLGCIVYFIFMKLSLVVFHIDMNSYRGANSFGIDTILQIPNRVVTSYISFYQFYFTDNIVHNSNVGMQFFNFIFLLLFIVGIIYFIIRRHLSWKNILGIVIFLLLIPFSICFVTIILPDTSLQLLMSSGFLLLFFFFGYLIQEQKFLYLVGLILLFFMIRGYFIQVEASYRQLESTYQKTYLVGCNIRRALEEEKADTVMIVGSVSPLLEENDMTYGFVSNYPLFWDEYTNQKNGWSRFMKYYLSYPIHYVEEDKYQEILDSKEYQKMDYYSLEEIDNVFVIKVK